MTERCKILRSLNRVYVFEIVLLLVPRLKILRSLSIWDFDKTSLNMACRVKLLDSTACIERSQEWMT